MIYAVACAAPGPPRRASALARSAHARALACGGRLALARPTLASPDPRLRLRAMHWLCTHLPPPAHRSLLPAAVLAANTAEVTTSDVRKGAAFDNIKASWGKALNIGDFKTNVRCGYDYNDNRDFLKEVSFQGDLMEGEGDNLNLSYDVNHK